MNKKNTKKFNKRLINNSIYFLPNSYTFISFDNDEPPMMTTEKPLKIGSSVVIKQFLRGTIKGIVKNLKREKRKFKPWEMFVEVKGIDRNDCLKIGE